MGTSKNTISGRAEKVKTKSHSNRGKKLEKLINETNKQYIESGYADVRNIPTPVQVTKSFGGKVSGFVKKGDLVDYIGVCEGKTLIFDAKETKQSTSYPLSKIQPHQYETLLSWWKQGADAFLVVWFSELGEYYKVHMALLVEYWQGAEDGGRKSIPYKDIATRCQQLHKNANYPLHYLDGSRHDTNSLL